MAADYSDYGVPAAIASQISALGLATTALQATASQIADAVGAAGVPLITLATLLERKSDLAVGAGATVYGSSLPVGQIGYEIRIFAQTGAAATVPFVSVALTWSDSGTGDTMQVDTYVVPAAVSPYYFTVAGRGPSKADQVQVSVTNLDQAVSATVWYDLFQNSRVADHDRWEWLNAQVPGLTVPGWTLPTVPPDRNFLGIVTAATIAAGASDTWLCGMHDGMIQVGINMNAGTLSDLVVSLAPVPSTVYGANNPLYSFHGPPASFQAGGCRAPVRLYLHNASTSSIQVTMSLTRAAGPAA